jgi:hypothetical protein
LIKISEITMSCMMFTSGAQNPCTKASFSKSRYLIVPSYETEYNFDVSLIQVCSLEMFDTWGLNLNTPTLPEVLLFTSNIPRLPVQIYIYVYIHVFIYEYTYMYRDMLTYIYMYIYIYICVYLYVYICIYIHLYLYEYTYVVWRQ